VSIDRNLDESIFDNEEASALWATPSREPAKKSLWAEPAPVPSDLSTSMDADISESMDDTPLKRSLWAEPAPVPSDLSESESMDATPFKKSLWAEPAPVPSDLSTSNDPTQLTTPVHTTRPNDYSPVPPDTPELKATEALLELSIFPNPKRHTRASLGRRPRASLGSAVGEIESNKTT
jgi:hypothetical protein